MTGLWEAVENHSGQRNVSRPVRGFPPLPTAPWKSRRQREISTFPQLRRRFSLTTRPLTPAKFPTDSPEAAKVVPAGPRKVGNPVFWALAITVSYRTSDRSTLSIEPRNYTFRSHGAAEKPAFVSSSSRSMRNRSASRGEPRQPIHVKQIRACSRTLGSSTNRHKSPLGRPPSMTRGKTPVAQARCDPWC